MHSNWHEIKRSWHFPEGASVTVGVERVSAAYRYPVCTEKMKMKIQCTHNYVGNDKKEKIWINEGGKEEVD